MIGPSNAYLEAMFSAACLYAATLIIFGMLGLHKTIFQQRKDKLVSQFGHPTPDAPNEESGNMLTNNKYSVFARHFFLRPQFVFGVVMGSIVIRNYQDPFTSCVIALGVSAVILFEWSSYNTKFMPFCCLFVGILYSTGHIIGYQNSWHQGNMASSLFDRLSTDI